MKMNNVQEFQMNKILLEKALQRKPNPTCQMFQKKMKKFALRTMTTIKRD